MLAPSTLFSTTTQAIIAPVAHETHERAATTTPTLLETQVSELAKEYGQDPVLALKIIKCEGLRYKTLGNNQNLDANGNVWSTDIGPWQINNYFHERTALSMGLDIYDFSDNLRYGFVLLSREGTAPWSASRYCWNK